ncbi:signal peptidase I [Rickettsia endosymbiont of Cardiosporidium cionae]|uniref:signal peptidase I n=1 Tax=Rickettsia endosymbiont of Cardiosporidium cionae TaxID=2777155 RepID=UPI001894DDEB|nr:signal peptidase I [Rickettsia endosymbiont of Cardiosporidium cionae]KAF8818816.1 signal peptidase I [Rickettsia endosymbiont of Cardiosporidium cionae]
MLRSKFSIKQFLLESLIVVISVLSIKIFLIELFFVPTGSMNNTILNNEYILGSKYSYGFSKYSIPFFPNIFEGRLFSTEPGRGDIVIMKNPNSDVRFIKRLIGMPGEKVEIINDVIYINDIPIKRSFVSLVNNENGKQYMKYQETLFNNVSYFSYKFIKADNNLLDRYNFANFGPYVIPQGHYFFLGDNRDESSDSRFSLGFVSFEHFIAKAQYIVFSTKYLLKDENTSFIEALSRIWLWVNSIRSNRLFTNLYSL